MCVRCTCALAFSVFLCPVSPLDIAQSADASEKSQVEAQRKVLQLMTLSHGLTPQSGDEAMQLLEAVKARPIEFVPVIENLSEALLVTLRNGPSRDALGREGIAAELVDDVSTPSYLEADPLSRLVSAIHIMKEVNPPSADALAGKLFVDVDDVLRTERDEARRRGLRLFELRVLSFLHDRMDRRVAYTILQRLPHISPGDRGPYYMYLGRSAVGDEWVAEQLAAIIDEDGALRDDPEAKEALTKVRRKAQ